jgi:hypothetical protein
MPWNVWIKNSLPPGLNYFSVVFKKLGGSTVKGKNVQVWMSAMMALLIPFMTAQLADAQTSEYKWGKVSFQAPVAFSSPQKVGLDAVALVHPPESGLGQGQMEITLVAVPKDMQESMGNQDAEILSYVKATFLASTLATKSVERSFLGRKVTGEVQSSSIPKKVELELYLVPLSDGDKVAVGFKRDIGMPKEKAESVINMVAQSFKEIKAP